MSKDYDLSKPEGMIDLFKEQASKNDLMTDDEVGAFMAIVEGGKFKKVHADYNLPEKMTSAQLRIKVGGVFRNMLRVVNFPDVLDRIRQAKADPTPEEVAAKLERWEENGRRGRRPGTKNPPKAVMAEKKALKQLELDVREALELQAKGPIPKAKCKDYYNAIADATEAYHAEHGHAADAVEETTEDTETAPTVVNETEEKDVEISLDAKGQPVLG